MKSKYTLNNIKDILSQKAHEIQARIFLTREDGIMVHDSQTDHTSQSVCALVSGVWQASEALMGLTGPEQDIMEFRFSFDTSSQGVYLFPLRIQGKKYFIGAIYNNCLNPGWLKRQITILKNKINEVDLADEFNSKITATIQNDRQGYLFNNISDDEMDRLFSIGGM